MKILLLGSLISAAQMEQLNSNSKEKASVAPVNYETMLAKGLVENGAKVDALSVPAVAAFPHSIYKHIDKKQETIENNIQIQWVHFVNIQGLKQLTIKKNVEKLLEQWLQENKDVKDKVVLMYSIYPPYTEPAVRLCKKYGCHLSAVITDLPEYMYSWKNMKGIRGWYSKILSEKMLELQGRCDSYILFTKPMAAKMGIEDKPYMVSEGFCDASIFDDIPDQEKYPRKTIVYGGNLSRLYGIQNLVKGFMQTDLDAELHLYGAGGDTAFIEECAKKDSRIKFFGRVDRKTLLAALKKTHLLVVNKPTADDYSNYSFSSKILEYVDSDDYIALNACERLYETAVQFDADIVQGDLENEEKMILNNPSFRKIPSENQAVSTKQFLKEKVQTETYDIVPVLYLVRRCLIIREKILFPEGYTYEDQLYTFQLLTTDATIVKIRFPFYFYRMDRPGSTTNHIVLKRGMDAAYICKEMYCHYLSLPKENAKENAAVVLISLYQLYNVYLKLSSSDRVCVMKQLDMIEYLSQLPSVQYYKALYDQLMHFSAHPKRVAFLFDARKKIRKILRKH